MNRNLELEIVKSLDKIVNLGKSGKEIEEKLRKLENQLIGIRASSEREIERIKVLGQKTYRTDGKPDSPEELESKNSFNSKLYKQKLELIQKVTPGILNKFENSEPTVLRNKELSKTSLFQESK